MSDIVELDYCDKEIEKLFSQCLFSKKGDVIEGIIHSYFENSCKRIYAHQSDNKILGIIGIEITGSKLTINHIAVNPEFRMMGIGDGLVQHVISKHVPMKIEAETDDEAVDFYRRIGFDIHSLGEKFEGINRYLCRRIPDPCLKSEDESHG